MEWEFEEFLQHLDQDPELHVLFVEGDHDLSFWRGLVPISERRNTAVYKIGSVHLPVAADGERGKIVSLAEMLEGHVFAARVKFFADADHDRILGRQRPESIILTDARDREAYVITRQGISAVCELGFNKTSAFTDETERLVRQILRPIGAVRVMSARRGEDLPFQQTLCPPSDPGRARRFWSVKKGTGVTDVSQLLSALLQNADRTLRDKAALEAAAQDEMQSLADLADDQIVHGKDLVAFVAWRFGCAFEAAQACINLALCHLRESLVLQPNLREAVAWVRQ